MLLKLLDDTKADHIAIIFDAARKTFRNDIYPQYKAHRPPPPDELIPQFDLVKQAVEAFNLPAIEMPGFEADDLIATYAREATEAGAEVTIVSSDKDMMQLVSDKVHMLDAMKNREIGPDEVVEKFGVGPDKVIDVQALAGDSTDNVPGVKGISETAAAQLINEYGDLNTVLERARNTEQMISDAEAKSGKLEKKIFAMCGQEFKISSPKQLGEILFDRLGFPGGEKGKTGAYSVSAEVLDGLAADGHEIAELVISWKFLNKVKSSYAQALNENSELATISRDLVTLKDDVPVELSLDDFEIREPNPDELFPFLREQNFKNIAKRMAGRLGVEVPNWEEPTAMGPPATSQPKSPKGKVRAKLSTKAAPTPALAGKVEYELVQDTKALDRWIEEAMAAGIVAVDTETTSLDAMQAKLVGMSLSVRPGRACYVPLGHRAAKAQGALDLGDGGGEKKSKSEGGKGPKQIALKTALKKLKPLLADPSVLKIGQNIKYDALVLSHHGIEVAPVDDTMLLSFVLDGGRHGHGMDELARQHLEHETIKFKDVVGSGKSRITFDEVPLEQACDYAAEDAEVTLRLHRVLKPRLVREHMVSVYETVERPLIPILAEMERAGILVDPKALKALSKDFAKRLGALEGEIHALAGEAFNIASPKQLGEILFEKLDLSGGKKTKTGAYGTDAGVLEDLAAQGHDLPARVLDWRQIAKLKSTYSDALVEEINPDTRRIHTSYAMAGAQTGRLASTDPNLQNIPVRTEEGRKIRAAFIAAKGAKLVSLDYSQIELRVLAHMAGIETLVEAFREGQDIHALTASQVFGVPQEGMDPMVRRQAKAINFGIIYGISAFGLARQLGISNGEAKDYIDAYFVRYPGIRDYMNRAVEECRAKGFVETLFGRRIHLPTIDDKNNARKNYAERQAINAPIQGAAADIIKRAMIRVPAALAKAKLQARMLLQVHDELLFEAPTGQVDDTIAVVSEVMAGAAGPALELAVPLEVEAGVGANWAEAH